MKQNPRFLLWAIVIITVLAITINIPKTISLSIPSFKIPFTNQTISYHKEFPGFNPDFFVGPVHIQRDLSLRKGLDLDGGASITLRADMTGIAEAERANALESAKIIVERRINFFGVSEPVIQTATVNKDYRIIVELSGVSDVSSAIGLIGRTAQLTFWEEGKVASNAASAVASESAVATASGLPLGMTQILGNNPVKTNLTGKDLQQANVTFDPQNSQPQVQLVFTSEGIRKFADITTRNVGKPVVIVLDNEIISFPRVNQAITSGDAVISGGFTTEQAKALSIQLKAGSLPIPLSVIEQRIVGPTLGAESLQKSLFAGVLGFLVIVVFMSLLYGELGVIASIALVLYALYTLAIFRLIPITLSLAGIAGFILSIGMAVDANILIFERMKEEMRRGKTKAQAIELGFSRAWTSIRDSNISTIITSVILFQFGTGIIRGFALTLAIGVLVSMFSAIVVTRTLLRLIYK